MPRRTAPAARPAKDENRPARRKVARQPLQERGRARFEALLDTLEAMLAELEPDQIGYYQIAQRAGMPAASIYHFFPTKGAAFQALAKRHQSRLRQRALHAVDAAGAGSWQEVIHLRHERVAAYFNAHPTAMKVVLGVQPFLEAGSLDTSAPHTSANVEIARQLLEELKQAFHFPFIAEPEQKLLISQSIADAVWRLSFASHGRITPDHAREATQAVLAYMRTFLPEVLARRGPDHDDFGSNRSEIVKRDRL